MPFALVRRSSAQSESFCAKNFIRSRISFEHTASINNAEHVPNELFFRPSTTDSQMSKYSCICSFRMFFFWMPKIAFWSHRKFFSRSMNVDTFSNGKSRRSRLLLADFFLFPFLCLPAAQADISKRAERCGNRYCLHFIQKMLTISSSVFGLDDARDNWKGAIFVVFEIIFEIPVRHKDIKVLRLNNRFPRPESLPTSRNASDKHQIIGDELSRYLYFCISIAWQMLENFSLAINTNVSVVN